MASPAQDTTLKNMVAMLTSIGKLRKLIVDNEVTAGKTEMTALKALVDTMNTAVQASSDFNTLT